MHRADPTNPRFAARSGYSLIELLTVMVLIGVTASLVAPRLDFEGMAVRSEVEAVGSELMRAQRRAVQRQHEVIVAIDAGAGRLRVHDDVNGNLLMDAGETVTYHPLGDGVRIARGVAPALFQWTDDVSFTRTQAGLPAVTFYRNGSASEEGGFYLTSRRSADDPLQVRDTRAVRIQRSTGRPEWFRYTASGWERGR